MDKEIKRRKKRFWAFCLAVLLVLCNTAPMIVEANDYSMNGGVVTPSISNGTYIYPGDVFNYDNINENCVILYYDMDGIEFGAASHYLSERSSVKSYSEAGGIVDEDLFLHWIVINVVVPSGNYVSRIELQAERGTKRDIVYHLDGGSNDPNNPTTYVEGIGVPIFAPASKDGHDFKGWYSDATFGTQITSIPTGQSGDVNLYAKFEPKDYGIVYHLDGGSNDPNNPTSYKYGIGVSSFGSASKVGNDFKGWYRDAELTTSISSISAAQTGIVNLYAKFEPKDYDIEYHLDGGSNASGNPTSYKYGIGVSSFASASKAGHTFGGWYSDAEFTKKVTTISATQLGDIILYAKYTTEEVAETKNEKETTKIVDKNVEPKTGDTETVAGLPIIFLPVIMIFSGVVIIFMIRNFKKNRQHKK